ncbi:hypothetical protein TWF730_010507 [Orbilia blumenaviensis]|uniref:Uncharacterized protein n=1 Tax=Orbilia blumenaviensis TaxID=1796055 RepID=A0AAV9UUR1_9PEZI
MLYQPATTQSDGFAIVHATAAAIFVVEYFNSFAHSSRPVLEERSFNQAAPTRQKVSLKQADPTP